MKDFGLFAERAATFASRRTSARSSRSRPDLTFQLTPIGCELAVHVRDQIGPMFDGAPRNVL